MNAPPTYNLSLSKALRLLAGDIKWLAIYTLAAAIVGVIVALTTPKEYTTTVKLAPEESSTGMSGNFSSLASMVGIKMNFGQSNDAIYPEIYPEVMQSTDYLVTLFPIKVKTRKGDIDCDYQTYLTKHQKSSLISMPLDLVKKGVRLIKQALQHDTPATNNDGKTDPFCLTEDEHIIATTISQRVTCSVDKKTEVISIKVTDQDPYISACMADSAVKILQRFITDYRTQKARGDVEYLDKLKREAEAKFEASRNKYVAFGDSHKESTLEASKSRAEELKNDMQLNYTIYTQLVEQQQIALAKLQERTPAFTTLQRASVPLKPSSMPKVVVLAIFVILGVIIRSTLTLWRGRRSFVEQD